MITGEQLREARSRAGLTQDELAVAVGVAMRSVGNWERGAGVPRNREGKVRAVLAGHLDGSGAGNPLASVPDVVLISELARRLGARIEERSGGDGRDAAPMSEAPALNGGEGRPEPSRQDYDLAANRDPSIPPPDEDFDPR